MKHKTQKRTITICQSEHTEVHVVRSLTETQKFVKKFVARFKGGDVIALSGNLGAGKTTFVQMLGEELGVKEQITSPTFVLMRVYPVVHQSIRELCHIDAYRLGSARDLEAIGADDYIGSPTVLSCIEWPERVAGSMPDTALKIDIAVDS